MINKATYEEDIGILRRKHFGVVKKHIGTQTCVKIPEHINICTVAMNDKIHKQTDKIKYYLVLIKCIVSC